MPNTLPTDRSLASLRQYYRELFPLYGVYCSVIEERNGHDQPITEPMPTAGTVSNTEAARIALRRLGRDTDDLSAAMAEAYVQRLDDEIHSLTDERPDLDTVVLRYFFQFAGCVPTPADWLGEVDDEQIAAAEEIAEQLDDEMIVEAVRLALPTVLGRIIAQDTERREKARRSVAPRDPACLPGCKFAADRAGDLADPRSGGHVCVVEVAVIEAAKPRPVVVQVSRFTNPDGSTEPTKVEVAMLHGSPDELDLGEVAVSELCAALARAAQIRAEVSA